MRIIRARYRSENEFLRHYQPAFDAGGVFYPTREALEEGTAVLVEVRLPSLPQRIVLRGTVAWRRAGRHSTKLRAGLGIAFDAADSVRRDFLLAAARGEIAPQALTPRRHRRLPVDLVAEWRLPQDRTSHPGRIEDIGPGGAFIRTDTLLERGTEVFVEMVPPGSVGALPLAGRVAWVRRTPSEEGFGIEFRSRDAGGTRRLKELVRRLEEMEREAVVESDDEEDGDSSAMA